MEQEAKTNTFRQTVPLCWKLFAIGALLIAFIAFLMAGMSLSRLHFLEKSHINEVATANTQKTALETQLADLDQNISHLTSEQTQLSEATQKLAQQVNPQAARIVLQQSFYLLELANESLTLQRNIARALFTIDVIDERIKPLLISQAQALRQALVNDKAALKAAEVVDIVNIYQRLQALRAQTDAVSFVPVKGIVPHDPRASADQTSPETAASSNDTETQAWQKLLSNSWQEMKSLVKIRRHDAAVDPLITIDEQHYFKANVKLQLDVAASALMMQQTAIYQQAIAQVVQWLVAAETQVNDAAPMLTELNALLAVNINPSVPDLTDTLALFQKAIDTMDES